MPGQEGRQSAIDPAIPWRQPGVEPARTGFDADSRAAAAGMYSFGATNENERERPTVKKKILNDGIWTWWNTPECVVKNGSLYFGFNNVRGQPSAGRLSLRAAEPEIVTNMISGAATLLEIDDHDNPALIECESGKLLYGFSQHNADSYVARTTRPYDITEFEAPVQIASGSNNESYMQFASTPSGRILLFTRRDVSGINKDWYLRTSDDEGDTWSSAVQLFDNSGQRPYLRIFQTLAGSSRIGFAASSAGPGDAAAECYLHHGYILADGSDVLTFYNTTGTAIGVIGDAPFNTNEFTEVESGATDDFWLYDFKEYETGGVYDSAITYSRYITRATVDHEYKRALSIAGAAWSKEKVADAGTTAAGDSPDTSGSPTYNGGIALDPNDYNIVYAGREYAANDLRMEKHERLSGTWTKTADMSGDTDSENIRPLAFDDNGTTRVLWCEGTYSSYTSYDMGVWTYPALPYQFRVNKPTTPVKRSKWLHPGLQVYFPLQDASGAPTDIMGNYTASIVGTAVKWYGGASIGRFLYGFATTDYVTLDSLAAAWMAAAFPKWMAVLFRNTSTTSQTLLSLGSSSTANPYAYIAINSGATQTVGWHQRNDTPTARDATEASTDCNDGELHTLMGFSGADTHHRVFFDGIGGSTVSNSSIGTVTVNQATLGALRRNTVTAPALCEIYAAAIGWGETPPPDELHRDWITGRFSGLALATPQGSARRLIGGAIIGNVFDNS